MPSSDFTPNGVWASTPAAGTTEELTLPSGQTCAAKRVTVEKMIEAGILNDTDALTATVSQHTTIKKSNGPNGPASKELDEDKLLRDPEAIKAVVKLCDKAMPSIVVSPGVALHFEEITVGKTTVIRPLDDDQRALLRADRPGLVFTDQIDFTDKMFLFDWAVGGLKAMQSFRGESTDAVGSLANGSKPKNKAKRAPRNK